jgi:hypothetical protein
MAHQSMAFRWVADDLALLVDYSDVLADGDINAFLASIAARNPGLAGFRVLIYSIGGPNAAQRSRFDRQFRGKPVRVAVICTSSFTRVIVKAFHLMGFLQVAPFAPDQEEGAFRHLNMKASEIALARDELVKLRDQGRRFASGA